MVEGIVNGTVTQNSFGTSTSTTYCTARTTSSQNILQMVKWAEKKLYKTVHKVKTEIKILEKNEVKNLFINGLIFGFLSIDIKFKWTKKTIENLIVLTFLIL